VPSMCQPLDSLTPPLRNSRTQTRSEAHTGAQDLPFWGCLLPQAAGSYAEAKEVAKGGEGKEGKEEAGSQASWLPSCPSC